MIKFPFPVKRKDKSLVQQIFLGKTEAEGERNNADINFFDCFVSVVDVFPEIEKNIFIFTGRKGSGKSAIVEYLFEYSNRQSQFFFDTVRWNNVAIEKIIQTGKSDSDFSDIHLFEWLILVKLLSQVLLNESHSYHEKIRHLKKFFAKNSGLVDISKDEVKTTVSTSDFSVSTKPLNDVLSALSKKELKITSEKAPFYKLIPGLRQVLVEILKNDPSLYVLSFDDLDVGFNIKNKVGKAPLLALLRITRHYNNEIFSTNKINAKVLIFLRDDIKKSIMDESDTAKLFSSYSTQINWWEEQVASESEEKSDLKKFLEKRLVQNFKRLNISIVNNAWSTFVDESARSDKSTFKQLLEYTFYRPRDFILLFNQLKYFDFSLPISRDNIQTLINGYVSELKDEISNELSIHLDKNEIDSLFEVYKGIAKRTPFSFDDLVSEIRKFNNIGGEAENLIKLIFEYSHIGKIEEQGKIYFKCRDKYGNLTYSPTSKFILHKGVQKLSTLS